MERYKVAGLPASVPQSLVSLMELCARSSPSASRPPSMLLRRRSCNWGRRWPCNVKKSGNSRVNKTQLKTSPKLNAPISNVTCKRRLPFSTTYNQRQTRGKRLRTSVFRYKSAKCARYQPSSTNHALNVSSLSAGSSKILESKWTQTKISNSHFTRKWLTHWWVELINLLLNRVSPQDWFPPPSSDGRYLEITPRLPRRGDYKREQSLKGK